MTATACESRTLCETNAAVRAVVYVSGNWHTIRGVGFLELAGLDPCFPTPQRPKRNTALSSNSGNLLLRGYPPATFPTNLPNRLLFDPSRVINNLACLIVSNTSIAFQATAGRAILHPVRDCSCQAVSRPPTTLKSHPAYASGLAPMTR